MFPMIAGLGELRDVKAMLADEAAALGVPPVPAGIMVEVPAAAIMAARFAGEADFFSIGTNDLTQYTLAAERGNPRVAELASPFDPAVVELVHRVVEAAHARGRRVGVCGELAGDPAAVPLLVGLGVDELSMSPPAIARVRDGVRALDAAAARALALQALSEETAGALRARCAGTASEVSP
ncbi:MAG TPA: putative PEP-binding protein, partial [Anaeromyxobacteraceae bacterium]|nr:putative PEP-binding protein [Anaeromyxobacteraceae bacterium]